MPTSCCRPCASASADISKRSPEESVMQRRDADALVLFGATGDLCYRKLYPALYHLVKRRVLNVPVIGVARAGWNQDQFAERVKKSITDFVKDRDEEVVQRFVG